MTQTTKYNVLELSLSKYRKKNNNLRPPYKNFGKIERMCESFEKKLRRNFIQVDQL